MCEVKPKPFLFSAPVGPVIYGKGRGGRRAKTDLYLQMRGTEEREEKKKRERKKNIASVQFVLPNHVIALKLTGIIYVPLCAVLNLDRPTAFLYGCQEESAWPQEAASLQVSHLAAVRGWGWFGCPSLTRACPGLSTFLSSKSQGYTPRCVNVFLSTPHSFGMFKSPFM